MRTTLIGMSCTAALLLTACASSSQKASGPVVTAPEASSSAVSAQPLDAQPLPPVGASGSSVEVFSLDPVSAQNVAPVAAMPPQSVYPSFPGYDSSVTVFPLDGEPMSSGIVSRASGGAPLTPMPQAAPPVVLRPPQASTQVQSPTSQTPDRAHFFFHHGSRELSRGDRAAARDLGQSLASRGSGQVRVEGYASKRTETRDPVEGHLINMRVSMDRALTVSKALVRAGVSADRIVTTAYGDSHPAVPMDGRDSEAASRRVDVHAGQ